MHPIHLLHSQVLTRKEIEQANKILNAHSYVVSNDPDCLDVAVVGLSDYLVGADVGRNAARLAAQGKRLFSISMRSSRLISIHDWERGMPKMHTLSIAATLLREKDRADQLRTSGYQGDDIKNHILDAHLYMWDALCKPSPEMFKRAIEMECDWSVPSPVLGEGWLLHALKSNMMSSGLRRHEYIEPLLEKLNDVNDINEKGETPLMIACGNRIADPNIVDALLSRGANPNAQDQDGWTPLMRLSCLSSAYTPLPFFTDPADEKCVVLGKRLIDADADPNIKALGSSNTPLRLAAGKGLIEFCRLLIQSGAKVDVRDIKMQRASEVARASGHVECASMIEEVERVLDAHTDLQVETSLPQAVSRRTRL